MFITLSSDYLYVLAMLKTTPLVVTVGLSLTIPFAVVGDFLRGRPSSIKILMGALLVLVSFIAIGIDNSDEDEDDDAASLAGSEYEPLDVDRNSRTTTRYTEG